MNGNHDTRLINHVGGRRSGRLSRPPTFASKEDIYDMSVPTSIEMIRLRELRKATVDLIELMQKEGWIAEDSECVGLMDQAFLRLWNEFSTNFNAEIETGVKDGLFR